MTDLKRKVIIDTDPGVDDALAILYVLTDSNVEVLGISTVMGNVDSESVTRNAKFISSWIGDVPVWRGSAEPLLSKYKRGTVMGPTGLGNLAVPEFLGQTKDAVEEIIKVLDESKDLVDLLAVGPLTNLARVFGKRPELVKKVNQITIMGGSATGVGNMNRVAEFNFFTDPEAAAIVLQLPCKKVLVPLELCYQTTLEITDFEVLSSKKYYSQLMKMLEEYQRNLSSFEGQDSLVAYDVLAAFAMLHPEVCVTEMVDAVVETKGEFTRGMMVVDKRVYGVKNHNVELVTAIDRGKFKDRFFSNLGGFVL